MVIVSVTRHFQLRFYTIQILTVLYEIENIINTFKNQYHTNKQPLQK